jgi:riboflavin kinase/FMN adenylyltransferase
MRIYRHYAEIPDSRRGGVVALGNFDGLHIGHQAVIGGAIRHARELGRASGVMTFEPHPRTLFVPDSPPFRLTPFRIKARLIEAMGVDYLLMQHFDRAFASHSAESFVDEVLVGGLGVSSVVVGYDFAFGQGRGGSLALLQERAQQGQFGLITVGAQCAADGRTYSSQLIRQSLVDGHPENAFGLLGRAWEIERRVEPGDARGRLIGFPTANVDLADYLRPKVGVYAVRAGVDRGGATEWHDAVANLGHRPTFVKKDLVLEAHLFGFDGDLYGRHLRVALHRYLRAERKFDGIEQLKTQIALDCQEARAFFAAAKSIEAVVR